MANETSNPDVVHPLLQANAIRLSYDFTTRSGVVELPEGQCVDMGGCTYVFERIDSNVRMVEIRSGDQTVSVYIRHDWRWRVAYSRRA